MDGLRDEQPVERVAVKSGQIVDPERMPEVYGKHRDDVARKLIRRGRTVRSPGTASFPIPAFMAISQPLAALKSSSLAPSEITSNARSDIRGSSFIHQRKT